MDLFKQGKQGMKGPLRPAPAAPLVTRYSPVTDWNDDPFGADVFEPKPFAQKKPPPRPPPPRLPSKDSKTHFMRKPTVLTSLLSRKKPAAPPPLTSYAPPEDRFPKCEPKVQTGALIDLSSPPSSPTFTTRSSSDGVSVDSFGSETTSTSHRVNGNVSQAESGFEDDFDLFVRKVVKDDTFEDLADPFSPPTLKPVMRKTVFSEVKAVPQLKGPTIIRAKPARPRPPDQSALLRSAMGSRAPVGMTLNTTTPIQKVRAVDSCYDTNFGWDSESSPEREASPPMPSVPPPPPPVVDDDIATTLDDDIATTLNDNIATTLAEVPWPDEERDFGAANGLSDGPYAISLFEYSSGHPEDLQFTANTRITLLSQENDEWLRGSLADGSQGLFPANYVDVKVPLPSAAQCLGTATALYDFEPVETGDLRLRRGAAVLVTARPSAEWWCGESAGAKGQFPANYVEFVEGS